MPRRPPNILWIITTQWRAQACGCMGDPNARTPHLDALAAKATVLTQAVTPHPFGPFARAALLTGVPSPENGVRDYFDPLPADAVTVAQVLRRQGYLTAFFGKWHLARRDPAAPLVGEAHARTVVPPESRGGFEIWDGFESGFQLNDPWLHGRTSEVPERMRGYQSDVVCGRAAAFMAAAAHDCRPRFTVVSLESPHPPYDAPASGVLAGDPGEIILPPNVPRGGEAERRARRELAGYHAHIRATDRAIGEKLLATADADTAIVFTSVHGDMHGAHGLFRKGWPHEESVRVPLLVRMPEGWPRLRATEATPVSLLDLPHWAVAWAEGRAEENAVSASAAEAGREISMPSVVALPWQCDRRWRGWRTPARKLVLEDDGTPWLYFRLDEDPLEMTNRADDPDCRDEIAGLRAQLSAVGKPRALPLRAGRGA